jgi:hypothetical protein
VLALICLFLAGMLLPLVRSVWKDISGALKGLGALATALGLLAQFWYVSIYIPRNTQVGICQRRQLPARHRGSAASGPAPDNRVRKVGGNPYVGFRGSEPTSVLAVDSPINNNSLLLPGAVYTKDFVVVVPEPGIAALQVAIMVDYARQTRLVLGHAALLKHPVHVPGCPAKYAITRASPIQESGLRSFATGGLHLYSSRCAQLGNPFIAQTIGASVQPEPAGVESALRAHYGPFHNARDETFALKPPPPAAAASG